MSTPLSLASIDIIGPDTYAADGYPHEAWKLLRREAPVYYWDRAPGCKAFWAITKHADVVAISKRPRLFRNGPRLAVFPEGPPPEQQSERIHHLLNMDPPEHGRYRRASSSWFTPRAIESQRPAIEEISKQLLDDLASRGEADFVADYTAPLTLFVLADMLGVPRDDWRLMFEWTNQIAGSADPEFREEGADSQAAATKARESLFRYFLELAEQRRVEPGDDMVSVLANAEIEGRPIPTFELLSYCLLLVVAGNETTRNAASGGLLALIENPGELDKLRRDPSLVDSAVEEIVRWTSPVIQFCRTPVEDVELRGQKIRAGESLCLLYASANRDEEVFDEPDEFRVDRQPNPHVGFGIGEHFCLGANLARLELRVIVRQLAERLVAVELGGAFERMRSSFLGGVKRMPIRYELKAS